LIPFFLIDTIHKQEINTFPYAMTYKGRFAPSPTGPLHFGSLLAAVASYLQTVTQGGHWYVRIEDLDPPREIPGSANDIIKTLDDFGFEWNGEIIFQSERSELYEYYLQQLLGLNMAYPCACSRSDIAQANSRDATNLVYRGTCRQGIAPGKKARSIRVLTDNTLTSFTDRLQGNYHQTLESDVGDFIIRRADGLHSYQLAVVIDDKEQEITDIVRGCDLLDSTPRQIYLQKLLGIDTPDYMHIPVAVNREGQKLSKQTHAKPVSAKNASNELYQALNILGQNPPAEIQGADTATIWEWAKINWDPAKISKVQKIVFDHS
jgi:glutamyl-Q tRNA(Asp) synthetase